MTTPLLTPNLTPGQTDTLRAELRQLTRLSADVGERLYADADRLAGRWFSAPYAAVEYHHARAITADLAAAYRLDRVLVAYVCGLAHGVRRGRTLITPPRVAKSGFTAEYRHLSEAHRRDVDAFMRTLRRAEREPARRPASALEEVTAARSWSQRARGLRR